MTGKKTLWSGDPTIPSTTDSLRPDSQIWIISPFPGHSHLFIRKMTIHSRHNPNGPMEFLIVSFCRWIALLPIRTATVTSPLFGPAKQWNQVHWRGSSLETPSADTCKCRCDWDRYKRNSDLIVHFEFRHTGFRYFFRKSSASIHT